MGRLQDRLDRIKAGFIKQAPPEALATMSAATAALVASGIADRGPAVGSILPAFDLPDSEGGRQCSSELLSQGRLVVTLYRGQW